MNNEQADFFDVALRPAEVLTPDGTTDPIQEWENLTFAEDQKVVEDLATEYLGICEDWIDP